MQLVAFVCGFLYLLPYSLDEANREKLNVIDVIWMKNVSFYSGYVQEAALAYVPLLFFHVFWGVFIYRHFCTAGIYFFSRNESRVKWFLTEALKLYAASVIYVAVFAFAACMTSTFFSGTGIMASGVKEAAGYIILYSGALYMVTLAINVLAMPFGSQVSFAIAEGVSLLFMTTFLVTGDIFSAELEIISGADTLEWELLSGTGKVMITINPYSYLVSGIYNSQVNEYLGIVIYACVSAAFLVLGCVLSSKHEFLDR